MRNVSRLLILACALVGSAVAAQTVEVSEPTVTRGQAWSVYSGYTAGAGNTVLSGQVGWPGVSFGVLHGASRDFDLGGKFSFNYGYEGLTREVLPGIKLQGVARLNLVDTGRIGLGLEFAPGPFFYWPRIGTRIGLALPLKLSLGIPVGSAILINAGMDVPMFIRFGDNSSFTMPLLFGGGVEYFIDRNLAASFNLKMGPAVEFGRREASFALEALVGVSYRL